MKFAISKGEKELAELTTRLYDIKGRGAAEAAKKAEAALLKANPHISDLSKIREGTLIVIPDAADVPPVRGAQTAPITADFDEALKLSIKELGSAFTRSAQAEESAAAETNELLKSREVKEFAAQSAEAKEQIEKLSEALKNQAKDAKADAAAEKEALKQLQEALATLNL
jgi:hypothetical protein